ncbi:M56 family metallopeptidase [Pontibacter cellulosilyticus]|uniref:M56 family metallopeptidase n=1 Tax=Pontibacter cellulosilyticus TaxID=1720253 RepID=A0A923SJQ1_9BACT|nr:M56 family metallopeptidase [Pontibacter cellulosilyticus]MBC5992981.1 M56 family metallopeptidase [Pontibacter cellulosilyticus]
MPALLLYLLKANVALVLFYLAYHFVLRRLTFYNLNRAFLLFGIMFSVLYPLVDLSGWFSQHQELAVVNTYVAAIPAFTVAPAAPEQATAFDYWLLPVYLFWLGAAVILVRLVMQFTSLYKIHTSSEPALYRGIGYRQVKSISHAFSFWQSIYLNPEQHKQQELDAILSHELVHVKGWHTLDVLFTEFSALFYWFNPGGWLMKKAIKENLEFIADQNVLTAGVDRKDYQYLLLKVTGISEPQIANQFNLSPLKTRIAMMNKLPSTKAHLLKFLAVIPVAAVLLLTFNGIAKPKAGDAVEISQYTKVGPDIYIKKEPTFTNACWTAPHTLTITPIAGDVDEYQLDNEQDIAKAYKKYGLYLPDNELYDKVMASIPGAAQEKRPQVVDEYKEFYARNPQVRKLFWTTANQIIVRLEKTEEIYNLEDKASRAAAEKKYGKLPSSPPPAEVVTQEEFDARSQKVIQETKQKIFIPEEIEYYKDRNNLPVEYTNFLKRNPTVKKVGWTMNEQKDEQIVLFLKSGGTELYELNDAKSMAKAKSKYGELPGLLPPPPPVMIKKN